MTADMPILPVPTMAVAWAIYLGIVFIPRVTWLMDSAGTCLGQTSGNSTNLTGFETQFASLEELAEWEGNALTTILAIGSTFMLLALAIAGYGQHGLLKSGSSLDFDMAEAAFSLMDGIEFLGVFWEDDVTERCAMPVDCSLSSAYRAENQTTSVATLESYICHLNSTFGALILAVVVFCFVLPFLALWQFKRNSAVLKGEQMMKDTTKHLKSVLDSLTSSIDLQKSLKKGQTSQGVVRDEQFLSAYHADFVAHRHNARTRRFMEKELNILKLVYVLWDMILINLAGAIIRFILWFRFNRTISALITKNVLAVMFRSLNLFNDYGAPFYHKHWGGKEDEVDAGDELEDSLAPVMSLRKLSVLASTSDLTRRKPSFAEDVEECHDSVFPDDLNAIGVVIGNRAVLDVTDETVEEEREIDVQGRDNDGIELDTLVNKAEEPNSEVGI